MNFFGSLRNVLSKTCGGAHDYDHIMDDLSGENMSHSLLSLKPPASLGAATHIG